MIDIFLNTFIPLALYKLSKRYRSPSELMALSLATVFPLAKSIYDFVRHQQLDPVSLVVLLGIITNGIALLLGGDARILLVREGCFFPGRLCFISDARSWRGMICREGNGSTRAGKFPKWFYEPADHGGLGSCVYR